MPDDIGDQSGIPLGVLKKVRGELVNAILSIQEQLRDPTKVDELWRRQASHVLSLKQTSLRRVNAAIQSHNRADYPTRTGPLVPLSRDLITALRKRGLDADPELAPLISGVERLLAVS